jgi:hypothetical protein
VGNINCTRYEWPLAAISNGTRQSQIAILFASGDRLKRLRLENKSRHIKNFFVAKVPTYWCDTPLYLSQARLVHLTRHTSRHIHLMILLVLFLHHYLVCGPKQSIEGSAMMQIETHTLQSMTLPLSNQLQFRCGLELHENHLHLRRQLILYHLQYFHVWQQHKLCFLLQKAR